MYFNSDMLELYDFEFPFQRRLVKPLEVGRLYIRTGDVYAMQVTWVRMRPHLS